MPKRWYNPGSGLMHNPDKSISNKYTYHISAQPREEHIKYQHSPEKNISKPSKVRVSSFKLQQTHSKYNQSFIDKEMQKSYNGIFKYLNPR